MVSSLLFLLALPVFSSAAVFRSRDSAYHTVIQPTGNSDLCLDVDHSQFVVGTAVQLWGCNGTPAQKWKLDERNTLIQVDVDVSSKYPNGLCLDAGADNALKTQSNPSPQRRQTGGNTLLDLLNLQDLGVLVGGLLDGLLGGGGQGGGGGGGGQPPTVTLQECDGNKAEQIWKYIKGQQLQLSVEDKNCLSVPSDVSSGDPVGVSACDATQEDQRWTGSSMPPESEA